MMNARHVEFRNPKTMGLMRFLVEWESSEVECCPWNRIVFDGNEVPISGFNSDHECPEWRVIQCGSCGSLHAPVGRMSEVGP